MNSISMSRNFRANDYKDMWFEFSEQFAKVLLEIFKVIIL